MKLPMHMDTSSWVIVIVLTSLALISHCVGENLIKMVFAAAVTIFFILVAYFLEGVATNSWEECLDRFILILLYLLATFFLVYSKPLYITRGKKQFPRATIGLIVFNALIFIISRPQNSYLYKQFAFHYGDPDAIGFVMSLFHHGDFWHLFWNMLFFWVFASYLEAKVGARNIILLYLVTGWCGKIISVEFARAVYPNWLEYSGLGASGAVCGIMGAFLLRCRNTYIRFMPVPFLIPYVGMPRLDSRVYVLLWLVLDVTKGLFVALGVWTTGVGHAAHVGGFLAGMACASTRGMRKAAVIDGLFAGAVEDLDGDDPDRGGAERKLLRVIELDPLYTDAYLPLARIASREYVAASNGFAREPHPRGRVYYEKAIALTYRKSRIEAGTIFMEYFSAYLKPLEDMALQAAISRILITMGHYEAAERTLEAVTKDRRAPVPAVEEAYVLRGKILADCLGLTEAALRVYDEFLALFPRSRFAGAVLARLRRMGIQYIA